MHDVLRQRLLRKIESLPESKIYQVLDYIEFLESKYAPDRPVEASGLQKLGENLQDRLRKKAMNPETIREAFQLIAAADRVLSGVSNAGKQLLDELTAPGEADAVEGAGADRARVGGASGGSRAGASSGSRTGASAGRGGGSSTSSRSGGPESPARGDASPDTRGPNEPPPAPRVDPGPTPPRDESS